MIRYVIESRINAMRNLVVSLAICLMSPIYVLAADDRLPPKMRIVATWQGPFNETRIVKYADDSDGVACYAYIPTNVASSLNCRSNTCATEFHGSIGSISCVKVFDPPSTTAKPR